MDGHTEFLFCWLYSMIGLPRHTDMDTLGASVKGKIVKHLGTVLTLPVLHSAHILRGKYYLQAWNPC